MSKQTRNGPKRIPLNQKVDRLRQEFARQGIPTPMSDKHLLGACVDMVLGMAKSDETRELPVFRFCFDLKKEVEVVS